MWRTVVLSTLMLANAALAWVRTPAQASERGLSAAPGLDEASSQTFADVPPTHPYYFEIEWLYQNGYTAGCSTNPLMYCPGGTMNRGESAVFVERGIHGATYDPPTPSAQVFADLAQDSWAAKWVNALWEDQYTAGCGTNPLMYCPWHGHTRAEGTVFYLRMMHGPDFLPPEPRQRTFSDVPLDAWYARWVQAAYEAGLILACQNAPELKFCPDDPLTRGVAAYMMVQAKSAPGGIFYVAPDGSDTNPGTRALPWKTIQHAADTLAPGEIVTVLAGDYATQRVDVTRSGTAGAQITFRAEGSVLTRGFNIAASYITVNGFEIADTEYRHGYESLSTGILILGAHNRIENNYIHDASMRGIKLRVPAGDFTATHDNVVRNNKLYHNQQVGIEVHGRNNLIDGNEIWGTVQCHPILMAYEDARNPGATCPNYATITWLDADGIDFFGQGHVFRGNYVHDIPFGPAGIDPDIGDYNDNPHTDCFQTWTNISSGFETAQNVIFDGNRCDNAQVNGPGPENGTAFMFSGGANNITIKNNIIKAYGGINTSGTGNAHHLYIYNNIWINDLSINVMWPKVMQLEDAPYSIVMNNIFYDQPYMTVYIVGDITGTQVDYNLAYNSNGTVPRCVQWGEWNTCQATPNHEIWNVNPQFVDPAANDYHLKPDSPAIDAGTAVSEVSTDFDGVPRPQGAEVDIGAFEFEVQ